MIEKRSVCPKGKTHSRNNDMVRAVVSIHRSIQNNIITILGVFVIVVGWVIATAVTYLEPAQLRVVFLDVGQGDAILVITPGGRELLIDAGPDQSVVDAIAQQKMFFDRTIDIILATHSDKDHIGGFPYVLDRFRIPLLIESEIASPTIIDRTFSEKISAESSNRLLARTGERIVLDPKHGVVVDILFPDQNTTGWETNEASVVAKISYGDTSFLLTGDAPSEVEDFLVATYGDQLQSDVLKLGHHGSQTSSSQGFLETVQPDIAIVSAGLGNRYGHPHAEVLEKTESVGAQILETAQMGNIVCRSDGVTVTCSGN